VLPLDSSSRLGYIVATSMQFNFKSMTGKESGQEVRKMLKDEIRKKNNYFVFLKKYYCNG
jgi:hypothetical protein